MVKITLKASLPPEELHDLLEEAGAFVIKRGHDGPRSVVEALAPAVPSCVDRVRSAALEASTMSKREVILIYEDGAYKEEMVIKKNSILGFSSYKIEHKTKRPHIEPAVQLFLAMAANPCKNPGCKIVVEDNMEVKVKGMDRKELERIIKIVREKTGLDSFDVKLEENDD